MAKTAPPCSQDAGQLSKVLADLPRDIGLHKENVEITVWFVLAGVLLAFAGVGLALWWNRAPGLPRSRTAGAA